MGIIEQCWWELNNGAFATKNSIKVSQRIENRSTA